MKSNDLKVTIRIDASPALWALRWMRDLTRRLTYDRLRRGGWKPVDALGVVFAPRPLRSRAA